MLKGWLQFNGAVDGRIMFYDLFVVKARGVTDTNTHTHISKLSHSHNLNSHPQFYVHTLMTETKHII